MVESEASLLSLTGDSDAPVREEYSYESGRLVHRITVGRETAESSISHPDAAPEDIKGAWWHAYLEGVSPTPSTKKRCTLSVVDLFCGAGGLALGLKQLCSEVGVRVAAEAIVDQDKDATRVYASNHRTRLRCTKSASSLVDHSIRGEGESAEYLYPPELLDEGLNRLVGMVDVVLAGPPCKGHSNLNNSSRRDDRRNVLYLTVPATAIALKAPVIIIENVPEVIHDSSRVVQTTREVLRQAGYKVEDEVITASEMGWPQNRRRHFLIARKDGEPLSLEGVSKGLSDDTERSVWWAIGDLENRSSDDPMDQATELSDENQRRIDWLFEHNRNDLALSERPDSHKDGTTYTSVYGRLRRDEPSPTITTGFMSPGRGRYIHPTERRVITSREAARIQGFPDTYKFAVNPEREPYRSELAKWIGDAVPMPLGYAVSVAALGPDLFSS